MDIVIIAGVVALAALLTVMAVRVVPEGRQDVVERFGRFRRALAPGVNVIVADRVRAKVDMREQVLHLDPHQEAGA